MKTNRSTAWLAKQLMGLCCFFLILLACSTAIAISKADILQPIKNTLDVYEDALKEIDRQAKMRSSTYDQEQKELEAYLLALDTEAQCARDENQAVEEADNLAVLTGWQLIIALEDRIFIPGYGRITMDELLALRDKHRKEHETTESEIESGTKDFFIAGLGMASKNSLNQRIALINEKRATLEKELTDGSIRIYVSGLGFVSKKEVKTAITSQKAIIESISKQINDGDYLVFIPGLGDISKKKLTADITALQEQIKALQQSFKSGEVRINRSPEGWLTEQDLTEKDKKIKADAAELKAKIKSSEFKHLLPIGWVTLKDLDARIAQLKNEEEAIKSQVADKQYKIALSDGTWATEKDIDRALMNSLLSMDIKDSLESGRKSIALASQYEIKQNETELAKLKKWKAEFKKHYQPLTDSYTQQLTENSTLRKEFTLEQRAAVAPLQQKLSFLQKSLRQLP